MGEYDIKPNSHKYKEEQKAKEQSQNKLKTAQQMAARGGRSGGNNSR